MKKYFLLLVFFTVTNILVSFISKIEINIKDQNPLIVKAQESPFFTPEEIFEFPVFKQEKSKKNPHCIILDGFTKDSIIRDINIQYELGYRLKGFTTSYYLTSTSIEKYIAVLCIDN